MKKISSIVIIFILFLFQWGQLPTFYANELHENDAGQDINEDEDMDIRKNDVTVFNTKEFQAEPNGTGMTIVAYLGEGGHVDIPTIIEGKPVTEIGELAFYDKKLTSVTIPKSVTRIEHGAFQNNRLTNVNIPNNITTIGNQAFFENNLTNVFIPDSVIIIGDWAFSTNQLMTVNVPASVVYIGDWAFHSNRLQWVRFNEPLSLGMNVFINQGSSFTGWYEDVALKKEWTNLITQPLTIYAKGNVVQYTLSFETNNGTNMDEQKIVAGEKAEIPVTPVKSGYLFAGWFKDKELKTPWNFATDRVTEDITLYVKWEADQSQYVLDFDANGGSPVPSQTITSHMTATKPPNPTKEGHIFAGWYKDEDFKTPWNFEIDRVTEDIILYAKWSKRIYNVQYHTDRATFITRAQYEEKLKEPDTPTRVGYTFVGWYKEKESNTPWSFATDRVTEDISLYAKWTVNAYIVTLHSNGGTAISPVTVMYNEQMSEPTAPMKEGHTFEGWYKDAEFNTPWIFEIDKVTENIALYGKWKANEYAIVFQTNGGTAISPVTVMYDKLLKKPANPTKEGHIFEGWYKDAALTLPWSFDTEKVEGNITLYARWEVAQLPYTLDFDTNGGSTVPTQHIADNATATEPVNPTKAGYTFAGWYKDAYFTIPWNFNSDKVMSNITLYAKWIINGSSGGGGIINPAPTPIPEEPTQTSPPEQHQPEKPNPVPVKPVEPHPLKPTSQPEEDITFSDVPRNHWAGTMIQTMANRGIITGFPDGTFKPDAPVQRQHVALMLTRALELEQRIEAEVFNDIPENHLYFEEIGKVQQAGLFVGIDGNFRPKAYMTRAQMAKVLVLALNLTSASIERDTFYDVPITHWAHDYISILAANGITKGDNGSFRPNNPVTRAEFAVLLHRALNN
ncbi:InlB B-repeat-containing protein [Lysinibacillus pakistanensis]|uniref:Leucine-rich repeat protein n=1 Tax=Lysinibacillus pakistanensis TaxID=759811 RepID=A0ABX6D9R7_9BACI|nr:leucine-rich repeat protein [Lysinibacillus pakistanensis]